MSRVRVYFTPFDANGNYDDEVEVTRDVISVGKISEVLDNTDLELGIFRVSDTMLKLRNEKGRYSEVGSDNSIFITRRARSRVRITWDFADRDVCVGFVNVPFVLPVEVTIYKGLLDDRASKSDIDDQDINFRVFGLQNLFTGVDVPFSAITAGVDNVFLEINRRCNTHKLPPILLTRRSAAPASTILIRLSEASS